MNTVGPSFNVNESALELLASMGEEIPIECLVSLGFHASIETAMRYNNCLLVKKATVYEWLTRGIPGTIGIVGEPGPTGCAGIPDRSQKPWYIQHMQRQRREQRIK